MAAEWMLEAARLLPGEAVLEIACGAGRVGLQAAEAVGAEGYVLCTDYAEPMVDAVKARIAKLGITNVEAQVLDAEQLHLEERFDAVLCRFGYMLMPNPARALENTAAALRPGGRVALAVWGPAEANPWLNEVFVAFMGHYDVPPPPAGTPGPFALSNIDHLRRLMSEAGLADIDTVVLASEKSYESAAAWWEGAAFECGGPLAMALQNLPDADADAIRRRAIESIERYAADGSLVVPASVIGARAMRPA